MAEQSEQQQWFTLFLEYLRSERNVSAHTLRAYESDLLQFFAYLTAQNWSIGEIRNFHVRMFMTSIHKNVASTSMARKMAALRTFYKFLIRQGYLARSPMEQMRRPKTAKKLPGFLTLEQVDKLLQAPTTQTVDGKRDLAMLEILYGSGVRVGELVTIEVRDLDLRTSMVKVKGKRKRERLVPVSANAIDALEKYLAVRPETTTPILFLNRFHEPLSTRSVHRMIKKYAYLAGLPADISPHTLRHTFASHMLNAGASLRALQELLGHSSLIATQIYTHITPARILEVYRQTHPRS